jgi:glycosyltransferase involved in cell wall biosynthesis
MRILLIADFEPDAQKSMSLYANWVRRIAQYHGHDVTVIRPMPLFARISRHPWIRKHLGYLDKFIVFPPRLARVAKEYDLIHVLDHSNSMYLSVVARKPKLITCHDLLAIRAARGEFPVVSTGWSGRLLQRWILSGLHNADYAICVSEKTAEDLRQLTEQACPKTRVIYHSLNCDYSPGASLGGELVAKLGLNPNQRYLIHVGANPWYKNRLGALRIFAHFRKMPENKDSLLIMVGCPWTREMARFVQENGLSGRAIEALDISSSELRELYCNAAALLFPSLEEGFGWPILEAQACGCLVVTTGRRPMTEVAGEAAVFIDPDEPEAAAHEVSVAILNGDALRTAGFKNLDRFNETRIASQYKECYDEVMAQCSSPNSRRNPENQDVGLPNRHFKIDR